MSEHKIVLRHLLETCHRLSVEACSTIRAVEAEREKLGASALDASLTDATDPRTYLTKADTMAQELIWKGLRHKYGVQLTIVGEEDPKDYEVEGVDIGCPDSSDIELDALKDYHIPDEIEELALSDVIVFIDPVDGTREFVEGRIDSCQCLIGISYRGRSIAGVVGLPFARFDSEANCSAVNCSNTEIRTLFGVVGSSDEIRGIEPIHQQNLAAQSELVLAISADLGEKHPTLKFVRETILADAKTETTRLLKLGGCGNKFLRVMTGEADVAVMNLSCSFWDTCATEALVVAAGGTVTTYTGWALDHVRLDDNDKESYKNKYGVLVTGKSIEKKLGMSHAEFVKRFIANNRLVRDLLKPAGIVTADDEEVYVVDMMRSIQDGTVITADDLSKMIGHQITSYHALERDAVRYKQSHACRLRFDTGSTAFLKRIVLRELPGAILKAKTMPHKLERDIKANVNESNFLKSDLIKKFNDAPRDGGLVKIVRAYDCQARVYRDIPLDSRFLILLEDFSEAEGWHQYAHLDEMKMKATLRSLAKFHAFFWLKDGNNKDSDHLRGQLWPVATYWDVEKQTADQIGMIESIFTRLLEEFGILDEETETRKNEIIDKNYGAKLAALAKDLDNQIHNSTEKQTLIHGDAKSANFFYRERGDEVDVGLIDFQWTGAGLCAVDVAYAMWACPELEVLEKECQLVDFYHEELLKALRTKFPGHGDVDDWISLEQLQREYRMAFLDFSRCVVGDHWRSIKVDTIRGRQAMPPQNKKVFNAYNKDVAIAKRMLKKMMETIDHL